ncbi:MAG: BrnT family toxin [Synechococcaceae cyanobacterium SM1_2_3]|nr:BrnT family toxin [Synechococcaceae cyanobacterium SM1_2_3]
MRGSDPDHLLGEYQFFSMGQSNFGNLLVVSYTERYQNQIRVISACKATQHEQKHYERNH